MLPNRPACASASPSTRSGIALPPTCWRTAPISASSRCCSGIARSIPPRITPRYRRASSAAPKAPWITWRPARSSAAGPEPRPAPHPNHALCLGRLPSWPTSFDNMARPTGRRMHALPLHQHRLMQAIVNCRTAALGGAVEWCDHCQNTRIVYRSCRDRHCPKCQGLARERWIQQRLAELLPVEYFHVVFTVPEQIAAIAFYNKVVVYQILFRTVAATLLTIARDPQHLGAEIGFFAVLHTWGQNLHRHPHLHCVVPGGGLSPDGVRKACLPGFFLPVRVLSRLFRRLFLEALEKAYADGQLQFFSALEPLREASAFAQFLAPVRQTEWVVYAKPPFGGPPQVIEYLGRYTHRVAISNQRLVALPDGQVSFRWKDYRHPEQHKVRRSPPRSSSAVSCCMRCRPAFSASATSACSPTATGPVSCSSAGNSYGSHRGPASRAQGLPGFLCGPQRQKPAALSRVRDRNHDPHRDSAALSLPPDG